MPFHDSILDDLRLHDSQARGGGIARAALNWDLPALDLMVFPLRNLVYEKVKAAGHLTDKELIELLKKEGVVISLRDLNKALMHLEIMNLISVRWVGKNKRRIEALKKEPERPRAIW